MPRADAPADDTDTGLPEPGRRWGAGAQSVLPYLTKSLQARPAHAPEARESAGSEAEDRRSERPFPSA